MSMSPASASKDAMIIVMVIAAVISIIISAMLLSESPRGDEKFSAFSAA